MNYLLPIEYTAPLYFLALGSFCVLIIRNWRWLSADKFLGHLGINLFALVIAGVWIQPLNFGRWASSVNTFGDMAERGVNMVSYSGGVVILLLLGLHQGKLWLDAPR